MNEEYKKFDQVMNRLLKVPHSEIKAKLDAEKAEKQKKKRDRQSSIRGKAHNGRDT